MAGDFFTFEDIGLDSPTPFSPTIPDPTIQGQGWEYYTPGPVVTPELWGSIFPEGYDFGGSSDPYSPMEIVPPDQPEGGFWSTLGKIGTAALGFIGGGGGGGGSAPAAPGGTYQRDPATGQYVYVPVASGGGFDLGSLGML